MKHLFIAVLVSVLSLSSAFAREDVPGLTIKELADGVYLHQTYDFVDGFGLVDANGLIVVVNKDAYLIDTPWSAQLTEQIAQWISAQGFTLKAGVSTHFHEDRSAGIDWLRSKSIPTYASVATNRLLQDTGKTQAEHAITRDDFWLVKDKVEIFYPGAGHSKDNQVVWLPDQKILFGGCLIRPLEANNLGNVGDAVIEDWSASAAALMAKYPEATLVVPGHGQLGDAALLQHTRDLAAAASRKLGAMK
jgi:glyoxylase-like metal-dependent hydrolase (beta-lactamase superfamily II)